MTIRLAASQAMIRVQSVQVIEGGLPFLAGCRAIPGHGNVASRRAALHARREKAGERT